MDGSIGLESQLKKGTTVNFSVHIKPLEFVAMEPSTKENSVDQTAKSLKKTEELSKNASEGLLKRKETSD